MIIINLDHLESEHARSYVGGGLRKMASAFSIVSASGNVFALGQSNSIAITGAGGFRL